MKISIIIAIYNIGGYLKRCLDSVIRQTYQNLEIILVDDGSTDGSEIICDEYAEKDHRIKVIHKVNGGLSDAWNTGLASVSGDFIGYVDGDDFIELDMYEKMLNALIENQAEVAICRYNLKRLSKTSKDDVQNVKEQRLDNLKLHSKLKLAGGMLKKSILPNTKPKTYILSPTEALEYYLREDEEFVIMPSVWSKLYCREVVYGIGFTYGKTSQDIMYTTQALCNAKRIVYLDEYLYNYDVSRNDSITNKKTTMKRLDAELEPLKKRIGYLKSRGLSELSDKASYYFYRRMLFYYIDFRNEKDRKQAQRVVNMLYEERENIKSIYRYQGTKFGDKVRMRIFLLSPPLYHFLVKGYEKFIIPARTR